MRSSSSGEVEKVLEESVLELIGGEVGFNKETNKLIKKHKAKVHFIPLKYRVLGGFLQSLNIKFGNFIEVLIPKLITLLETKVIVITDYSKKQVKLELECDCERKIDDYINYPPHNVEKSFEKLLDEIFVLQNKKTGKFKTNVYDVDLLLKKDNIYYYVEVKYNDDHDTGKFKDINRKFLKTFSGLVHKLHIRNKKYFIPLIYYFNEDIRYKDIYLKENIHVLRGRKLFEKLDFSITFDDIDRILLQISKKLESKFDEFQKKIFDKIKNNKTIY